MKSIILKKIKNDLKKADLVSYPYLNLSFDECYLLYDKNNIIVQKGLTRINGIYTSWIKETIILKNEKDI